MNIPQLSQFLLPPVPAFWEFVSAIQFKVNNYLLKAITFIGLKMKSIVFGVYSSKYRHELQIIIFCFYLCLTSQLQWKWLLCLSAFLFFINEFWRGRGWIFFSPQGPLWRPQLPIPFLDYPPIFILNMYFKRIVKKIIKICYTYKSTC